ncbi:unnamed protein product [Symbiodinium sp. KB8]|nr:unnamed protein product [Symbiodinium sp. KB8]
MRARLERRLCHYIPAAQRKHSVQGLRHALSHLARHSRGFVHVGRTIRLGDCGLAGCRGPVASRGARAPGGRR